MLHCEICLKTLFLKEIKTFFSIWIEMASGFSTTSLQKHGPPYGSYYFCWRMKVADVEARFQFFEAAPLAVSSAPCAFKGLNTADIEAFRRVLRQMYSDTV